ncbi:hypothetical protein GCM10023235_65620 [Kitasatospora terrestris]|uniref:Uncharacterized protein n=1 Tax=Kitasatospora terrestris TaxID=258051 RepID=A0ABP9EG61_9ACTN
MGASFFHAGGGIYRCGRDGGVFAVHAGQAPDGFAHPDATQATTVPTARRPERPPGTGRAVGADSPPVGAPRSR